MTTTTAVRPREFTVSEATTSKQLYDQLSSLNTSNSNGQSVPIRAYKGKCKGTTRIRIYEKKTEAAQKFKAAANPQRVSARILVIKTIEKILAKESANCSSEKEKEKFDQVLLNIRSKKPDCNHHDLRVPELIADLQPLQAIWQKSDLEKASTAPSTLDATPTQRKESTKKANTPKTILPKDTKEKSSKKKKTSSTHEIKNNVQIRNEKAPRLKIARASFDLSKAINFLESVKKYSASLNSESIAKASFRVGKTQDSETYSFYISINEPAKIKKKTRRIEGRDTENKNITAKRAIEIMRAIANSLIEQNRLNADEVNIVFSSIEKQKFIGMKDIPSLLDLLEKGRRAAVPNATPVATSSVSKPVAQEIINFNTNPFKEISAEVSKPTATLAIGANTNPFEDITTPENNPSTTPKLINKTSTNPFEDISTTENTTKLPDPPNFLQRMSDFLKPIRIFFTSVRRFFGFN